MGEDMMFRDRRYIKLKKAIVWESENFGKNKDGISLGYFDSIEIKELDYSEKDSNWLEAAWNQSIRLSGEVQPKVYEHPLFIMARGDQTWKEKIDTFWNLQTQFLLVTFVHFVTPDGEKQNFFSEVETESEKILNEYGAEKVSAVCYHSIDASDLIIIWKTDYLVKALDCLQKVYILDPIGDLHTICSFSLNSQSDLERDEEIPYISLRFGVKDAKLAHFFLEKIRNDFKFMKNVTPYITTGTEDIDITLEKVKVSEFLALMNAIFNDNGMNKAFCDAFNESATHLGIPHLGKAKPRGIIVSNSITFRCETLLGYFQELRKKIPGDVTEPDYSWMKLVSVQLNALISMSRFCILDRFCYLILDSVQTFCENFSEWVIGQETITSERLRKIQKFVRAWGILMDQTVRADGQFTQDTGVNSVFYDIPVSLLEFYIAFTKRCMHFLQMKEGTEKKEHGLFLMPNLCRRTKVEDVFGNPPPAKRLLYVDVPLDYLYRPRQILYQLCHEISHFCGEEPRSRKTRAQLFTMNCAQLVVQRLHIEDIQTTKEMYRELYAVLDINRTAYMQETAQIVWKKVKELLLSREKVQGWVEQYLENKMMSGRIKEDMRHELILNYDNNREHIIAGVKRDVEKVVYLYTECYADVSMIFMLEPRYTDYIQLYHQELNWIDMSEKSGAGKYTELVQRIALVLLAVPQRTIEREEQMDKLSNEDRKLFDDALRLANSIKQGECNPQYFLPGSVMRQISQYLKYCYEQLNGMYSEQEELKEIRNTFLAVTEDFSDVIEEYRQTIERYESYIQESLFWKGEDRKRKEVAE